MPADVNFLFSGRSEFRIDFYFNEGFVVCSVSEKWEERIGENSYVYRNTKCKLIRGSLYEKWNDTDFKNFNVDRARREQ